MKGMSRAACSLKHLGRVFVEVCSFMAQSHASVENATSKLFGGGKTARKNPLTEIFKIINEMSRQSR